MSFILLVLALQTVLLLRYYFSLGIIFIFLCKFSPQILSFIYLHFSPCLPYATQNISSSSSFLPYLLVLSLHSIFPQSFAVVQWLRCCATNRKVVSSFPDGVIGIFHSHNPSDRTMALGSTQSLTEMSTRRISWGKCGRCVRLTTLTTFFAVVMKSGNLNFLEPFGLLQACNGTDLPLSSYPFISCSIDSSSSPLLLLIQYYIHLSL